MKSIKILSLLISFGFLLSACSENKVEEKKSLLQEKKESLATLKSEIKSLESDLKSISKETDEIGTAVNVKTLTTEKFIHSFEVNANLKAVKSAILSPEMSGQIKEVLVKEGDRVVAGQVLARLNSRQIESGITEIKVALDLANQMFMRQQKLWSQGIGSEIEFLTSKNNKESLEAKLNSLNTQLEMATLNAPISGVVDQIVHKEGEMAMPGMALMQIININEFVLQADVAETHLASLNVGDEVEVFFPSFPELNLKSKIYRIGQTINPENRSFIAEVKIRNTNNQLKPNMLALSRFIDFEQDNALIVPANIIKNDFKGAYLYIVIQKENNSFAKKVYVKTGLTMGNSTLILSGLEVGQIIIVKGNEKVVDGSKLLIL